MILIISSEIKSLSIMISRGLN